MMYKLLNVSRPFSEISLGIKNVSFAPNIEESGLDTRDLKRHQQVLKDTVLQLKSSNDLVQVIPLLKAHLYNYKEIDVDIIYDILATNGSEDESFLVLYDICKLVEPYMINDIRFQEIYITIACNLRRLLAIVLLVDVYLQNHPSLLQSSILENLIKGCCVDYQLETGKIVFLKIVNIKKDLDPSFLSHTLDLFIKHDSLFPNILYILEAWIFSGNTLPGVDSMIQVLSEAYKFGTVTEIREAENLVHRYGLADDYLVKHTCLKYKIINNNLSSFKKHLTSKDIQEMDDIALTLNHNELQNFYYLVLEYVYRYCYFEYMEMVLDKMRQRKVKLNQRFYVLLIKYYVKHENFLGLVKFFETQYQNIQVDMEILRLVYECFVRSYPKLALEFQEEMRDWIQSSELNQTQKQSILSKLVLYKTDSSIKPFAYRDKTPNPIKYKSKTWANYSKDDSQIKNQTHFRVKKGFGELIKQGVRPDFYIIEETFRHLHLYYRTKILELTHTLRMEHKNQNRLSMINLQRATQEERWEFYTYNLNVLNSHDKIRFARILFNKRLNDEALETLNQVNLAELNDYSYSMVLISKLRILMCCQDYDQILKELHEFPIEKIKLHEELLAYAKKVATKMKYQNAPMDVQDTMQTFIADVAYIIEKDVHDLGLCVQQMFGFLDIWVSQSTKDVRAF